MWQHGAQNGKQVSCMSCMFCIFMWPIKTFRDTVEMHSAGLYILLLEHIPQYLYSVSIAHDLQCSSKFPKDSSSILLRHCSMGLQKPLEAFANVSQHIFGHFPYIPSKQSNSVFDRELMACF
jgi:hypothetical protein